MEREKIGKDESDQEQHAGKQDHNGKAHAFRLGTERGSRLKSCQYRQRCKNERSYSCQQQTKDRNHEQTVGWLQGTGSFYYGWIRRGALLGDDQHLIVFIDHAIERLCFFQVSQEWIAI